jgi:addiction module HigA family antidote
MTQSELATRLGVPFPRVNEIVRGRRGITADTALRLEAVLGTPAEGWMALQSTWELWRAREEAHRSATSGARRGRHRRPVAGPVEAPRAAAGREDDAAPATPAPDPARDTAPASGAAPDPPSGTAPIVEPEPPTAPFQQLELL